MANHPSPNSESNRGLLDELQYTLVELDKAVVNLNEILQVIHSSGILEVIRNSDSGGNLSLSNLLKGIDYKQIMAIVRSPVVQQMVSDPEFLKLFEPDTGNTPGTPPSSTDHEQAQEPHK